MTIVLLPLSLVLVFRGVVTQDVVDVAVACYVLLICLVIADGRGGTR